MSQFSLIFSTILSHNQKIVECKRIDLQTGHQLSKHSAKSNTQSNKALQNSALKNIEAQIQLITHHCKIAAITHIFSP